MIFNTWTYGVFLTFFFIIYWAVVPKKARPVVLLLGGLLFYTYNYPIYTLLILAISIAVYGIAQGIVAAREKSRKKAWLVAGILLCLGVLGYYKYTKMLIGTLNDLFHLSAIPLFYEIPNIIVPLGLSFFVFEFIHYLVDIYQGKAQQTSPLKFGVFALFFPTLVAGPIKRYEPFMDQLEKLPSFRWEFLTVGVKRILIGIGKKMILADPMNQFITPFQNPTQATDLELWIAIYAYAIKIFFDFSGYSDIAIGSTRLLGFTVMENFNYPYLRRNIVQFWRNWHISLTSWIQEYLYIPLGGNRRNFGKTIRNTFIAWGASGLWHGAAWNFLVWGLYHGCGIVVYRLYQRVTGSTNKGKGNDLELKGWSTWLSIFITFQFVALGWIFFTNNIHDAFYILARVLQLKN